MTSSERFRKGTLSLFNRYGSHGLLSVPQDNGIIDHQTGDTSIVYDDYPIKYAGLPLETNPDSDYGLATFKQSQMTFYIEDKSVVVNETCIITDLNGVKWGFISLNTMFCGDNNVLAYEARVKAHL